MPEKKEKTKKGKVFISTSKGALVPFSEFRKYEVAEGESKQLKEKEKWMTISGLVDPPYPPESFLLLYESNSTFWACVNQIAQDVAGLGWNLQLQKDKKEDKNELQRIQAFLKKPNPDDSLRVLLKQLLVDWGSVGWFGIEVIRNNKQDVTEIHHVPAHTIRVHESRKKYCQKRNTKKVWFKKFGLDKDISPKDGKQGKFTQKTGANELIFYKNFYPKSTYYGAPNALAATGDIIGLIGIRDYNLAFFENYGVPAAIVILEGDWDDGSDTTVDNFINKQIKGAEDAHKTLVVTQPANCTFTYKPLITEVKEGSFRVYEQARKEAILVAYSMPPERVGVRVVGQLGGNVAEEATKIYVQGMVEPLQTDLENIINQKLLQSETYEFKFKNIDLRDYESEIKQLGYQVERGMMTPNEARNELGRVPYPEGDKFFMMSSLIETGEPKEPLSKIEEEFLDDQE